MQEVILDPNDKLVYHEEEITIPMSVQDVYDRLKVASLENLTKGSSLPSVTNTLPLNDIAFPNAKARRKIFLSDDSTAFEEVIENQLNKYFSYKVWGYTTKAAKPIKYAKGEFWYIPEGKQTMRLRWRYSFCLKTTSFPGVLGSLGRFLFRIVFLERTYADFMKTTIKAMREYVMEK